MLSIAVVGKRLAGDYIIEFLAHFFLPESERNSMKDAIQTVPSSNSTTEMENESWLIVTLSLTVVTAIVMLACLLVMFTLFYIPLPAAICDRRKIRVIEILMRISNEYVADFVELLFGPITRNKVTRWLCAFPFVISPFGPPKWCTIREELIAGIRCRVYLPQGRKRKSDALIVYIHGGGWCIMRPKFYDGPVTRLISLTGTPVISIDYHLSPEVRFPTALLECERVLKAIYNEKHTEYGVDRSKIVLLGDSAGANMCAVLCQRTLRAGTGCLIKAQILMYPVIHQLDFNSPSYQLYYNCYKGAALLNPKLLIRWYLIYLGLDPSRENIRAIMQNKHLSNEIKNNQKVMDLVSHKRLPRKLVEQDKRIHCAEFFENSDYDKFFSREEDERHESNLANQMTKYLLDPDVCPLLGENLQGLAPALIITVGVDILRDEGMLYERRLKEFDVPVQLNHYSDAFHGFFNMPYSKASRKLHYDIASYLKKIL